MLAINLSEGLLPVGGEKLIRHKPKELCTFGVSVFVGVGPNC